MPRGRSWTTEEEQFIRENRQKLSLGTISSQLGRTEAAVEKHWRVMKQEGRAKGSLRHWKPRLVWCENCTAHRSKLPCPVCGQRELLGKKREEEARIYDRLPHDSKLRKRPQCHGTKSDDQPKPPDTRGMDAYSAARLNEIYDLVMQKWLIKNIKRENKTIQKRIERYRKELKL